MLLGTIGADILAPTDGGIRIEVDWNKNGFLVPLPGERTYGTVYGTSYGSGPSSDYLNDVTSRVRPNASPVSVEYGRDQTTALSPTVAGRGGFVLDNRDKRYSPRNVGSPLYGYMKPARPVRITRQIGSTIYQLFHGHTDDSPINPDIDARTVSLSLMDPLADCRARTISTPLYRDIRTGEAINYILDELGFEGGRDIDIGGTTIPWWWEDNANALDALEKVVRSEGPPALLSVGLGGSIVFRDRHHRILRPQSATSQDVWHASGPAEPIMAKGFTYDEAWSQIINTGTASVEVRTVQDPTQIWQSSDTITLAPNEQKLITAAASDPFVNASDPEEGTDYTLMAGSVTARLLTTSGLTTTVVLTAGSSGATVTGLQLRAQAVSVAYTQQVSYTDGQSVVDYGARSYPGDLPWCGVEDAKAVLQLAVAMRAQSLPILSVRFVIGNNFDRCRAILERDIGDRVTVVEPQTSLNTDFYIESIKHEFTGEFDHTVTFGLEMVPGENLGRPIFRLDTPGAGLDAGHLGTGYNDGITTDFFRLDTPGQGLNQGALAA